MNLPVPIKELDEDLRLSLLVERFASDGERSPHTRAAYRIDLVGCSAPLGECRHSHPAAHRTQAWVPWCRAQGLDPSSSVRVAVVNQWISSLIAAGDSEPTRARRVATVSSWYRWLIREDAAEFNPVERLRQNERPRSSNTIHAISPTGCPSQDQVQALLDAADAHSVLAAALLYLLAVTGARVSEVVNADIEDLREHRGHPALQVIRKGGKPELLILPPAANTRLNAHLARRGNEMSRLPTTTVSAHKRPLLARSTGARLTRQEVARLLLQLARRAGLPDTIKLSPHSLRHAFATDLIDAGVPIRDVQRAMGHASVSTTQRYDHSHLNPDRHPAYRRASMLAR